jgi:type IV secretion system protein VirB3
MIVEDFKDPLFKGCTRPSMMAGVPLLPFLLVTGLFTLLAMYAFVLATPILSLFVVMIYAPIYISMRHVTRTDDQRLAQLMLRTRMRLRMSASKRRWGAYTYSPFRYKG